MLGLAGWFLLTVLLAGPAQAHAALLSTDPAEGDVLDASPEAITLTFNEPVTPRAESTSLLDAEGTPVDIEVTASGSEVLVTPDGTLEDGSYIVSWRVISADDHPIAGGFTFSVGEPSENIIDLGDAMATDRLVELTLRIADAVRYATLLGTAGLLFFAAVTVPRQAWRLSKLPARMTRLLRWGLIGLAVSSIAALILDALWSRGESLSGLARVTDWAGSISTSGLLASSLGLLGVGAGWFFWRRALLAPLVVALIVATGASALTGHTRTYGQPFLTVTADIVHLATAAVWIGGIIGLIVVLMTLRPAEGTLAAQTVARFSSMAIVSVAALVATGAVLVWQIPGFSLPWPDLLYDRLLLAKGALVAVALAAAAFNRFVLVPRLEQASHRGTALVRLRRTLALEAVTLVAVVAVTAVLVSQVPRDTTGAEASISSQTVSETFDGGEATVVVTPGTVGVNALEITLVDDAGEPLEPEDDPTVELLLEEFEIGPLAQTVTPTGPGRYAVTSDIGLEGTWTIQLAVRVDRFSEPVLRMEVDLS